MAAVTAAVAEVTISSGEALELAQIIEAFGQARNPPNGSTQRVREAEPRFVRCRLMACQEI
jgi:hypothetical protein